MISSLRKDSTDLKVRSLRDILLSDSLVQNLGHVQAVPNTLICCLYPKVSCPVHHSSISAIAHSYQTNCKLLVKDDSSIRARASLLASRKMDQM